MLFSPNDRITAAMVIYLSVVIGIFGAFALACLLYIVYHRSNPVMVLSQAPFLATLVGACFTQVTFSFTYMPLRDVFCNMQGPLVTVPLHLGTSILLGRLWRVQKALGNANFIGRGLRNKPDKNNDNWLYRIDCGKCFVDCLSWIAQFPDSIALLFTCRKTERTRRRAAREHNKKGFRQKVTAKETWWLIFMLTLPQLVVQLLGSAFYPNYLEVQLAETGSAGRITCSQNGYWTALAGLALFILLSFMVVFLAWTTRLLPSAFNETTEIFRAAGLDCGIIIISFPLVLLSNTPTSSPDIQVFFQTLLSIGIATVTLVVIVIPKIRRVRNGDKVVIAKLLDSGYTGSSSSDGVQSHPTLGSETPGDGHGPPQNATTQVVGRIVLHDNDPIPRSIEEQLLKLQGVLRSVTSKW